MDSALDDLSLFDRPAWPFTLGRLAGAMLALAASVVTYGAGAENPELVVRGYAGFVVAAGALAIAFAGTAKQRHATVAPMFGCLAIVATAMLAWSAHAAQTRDFVPSIQSILYAVAVFPVSLLFARGLTYVRAFAALAALPAVGLVGVSIINVRLTEAELFVLVAITFLMFAVVGVAIAMSLQSLRTRSSAS